jgi:hypothetical protein
MLHEKRDVYFERYLPSATPQLFNFVYFCIACMANVSSNYHLRLFPLIETTLIIFIPIHWFDLFLFDFLINFS